MSDYSSPSPEDEVDGASTPVDSDTPFPGSDGDTTDTSISTDPTTEEDTDSGGAPEEPDVTDPS